MIDVFLHPSLVLILGALALPFVPDKYKKASLLLVPLLAFALVLHNIVIPDGSWAHYSFLDWTLIFGRVDKLSSIFALIMGFILVIGTLYGLQVNNAYEHMAAWIYGAGSLGVIYCGDYLSLFFFWEMMAFSSVFLIWFRRSQQSLQIGYRYIIMHALGGVILLAGILLRYKAVGDLVFDHLDVTNPQPYTWLIMIGFALNAAVVPLHTWLPESYGEASFNGAVFLCALTTKTAVYTLARGCAGMDILVPLGVIMALYGVVYAILENDIRRLLGWSIISQVGYMVAGVGIGTDMAVAAAVAHAVVHILYKSLLFMGTGAVLYSTGTTKFSELGGLWRKMPWTFAFTMVGCLSIASAPFFAAFASKSLLIAAIFESHYNLTAWLLMFAALGTILYNGLKLPWFLFFGPDHCSPETRKKAIDPPMNMRIAMGIVAFLCILVGSFPGILYALLPTEVSYSPYTSYQVFETLQMIGFTALVFFLLRPTLQPRACFCLDIIDWLYRKMASGLLWVAKKPLQWLDTTWGEAYRTVGIRSLMGMGRFWSWFDWHGIDGAVDGLARSVRALGERVRFVQSGAIQLSLFFAFSLAALLFVVFILLQTP